MESKVAPSACKMVDGVSSLCKGLAMAETEEPKPAPENNGNGADIAVIEMPALPLGTPSPDPAPDPAPPVVEQPKLAPARPGVAPGVCPECGKGGFNDADLAKHIRFKHDLPRARALAAQRKLDEARAAGSTPVPPADFSDIPGQPAPAGPSPIAVLPDQRFEGMANMTFDMSTQLLSRIFGPEWLPNADADNPQVSHERMTMVAAIKKYYESVNLPDIPPGYMLCFVCLAYAAPRMAAQPTKTKLQACWLWLKMKFTRRKQTAVPVIVK